MTAFLLCPDRGQIRSGSIVGAVTDKSGSAVAAAQVQVTFEQINVPDSAVG